MCGIAGYMTRGATADRAIVEAQLRCLLHRGPDAIGVHARGPTAIGQTRLSIIDLVTGDPPITADDGAIGVAMNGEIYSYRELRDELRRRGHVFTTTGDTEVIAHLAEETDDAVDLPRRLDGMFAFAVWDDRRQRLIVARDRVGKKPLYWWSDGRSLVFGSEIKAVLAHPAVSAELDADAIPAYLRFGYVPGPRTFYRGIHSLAPGHVMVVDPDLRIEITEYWSAPVRGIDVAGADLSLAEAAVLVRTELDAAVRRRLVSDVPLGAFLSGGIDSSAIVGLMAHAVTEPVRTFTIGFDDRDGFDERPYARQVAERFGTEHTEFVVSPTAIDLIERLVWHYDQPFGDSSSIPTLLLSEMTREHVTVALSGDGGDELFAGYERFGAGVAASRLEIVPMPIRRALVRSSRAVVERTGIGGRRASRVVRFLDTAATGMPDAFRSWIEYVPGAHVAQLAPGASGWEIADYERHWRRTEGAAPLDRLLDLNFRTYLADDLLPKADRMSMAAGLEVRAPFLDHRLIELAATLPPATKQRGMQLKRVLKAAVADLLPPELLDRPKRGFGVPLDRWFRDDLASYVDAKLCGPCASIRQHLDSDAIDRIVAEQRAGTADHGHALWTLLTLEIFLERQGW